MDFHGEKRSNETHESTTDADARLACKSGGHEAKLAYCGNVLIENRNGLVVDAELLQANGTAERDAALLMAERPPFTTSSECGTWSTCQFNPFNSGEKCLQMQKSRYLETRSPQKSSKRKPSRKKLAFVSARFSESC